MMVELALVLSLHGGRDEHPGGDRWFSADKAKHFFLSAFVQSVSFSTLRATKMSYGASLAAASALSAAVSVSKEVEDRRRGGTLSPRDLIWDAAGAVTATTLLRRTAR